MQLRSRGGQTMSDQPTVREYEVWRCVECGHYQTFNGEWAPGGGGRPECSCVAGDYPELQKVALYDTPPIDREAVRRRLAKIENGDYSVVEMAADLERLARHPVWERFDKLAGELDAS